MDAKIIMAFLGIVVSGGVFLILLPRNNALHRNISVRSMVFWLAIAFLIFVFCMSIIGKKVYRNGIGDLFQDNVPETIVDVDPVVSDLLGEENENRLVIIVHLNQILIQESVYMDMDEVQEVVSHAISSGKDIRVIDDYALASTYNRLIETITQMNISRSSIEEIKQP